MPPLLQALDAGVLTLTLDRPEQGNALDADIVEALHAALDRAELDAGVRVVVVRSAGADFCVGAELESASARVGTLADGEHAARRLGALFQRCHELPKPIVAAVRGTTLAGGAALAIACDVVIAGDGVRLGVADPRRGIVPTVSLAVLRRGGRDKLTLELALTGRMLSAFDAVAAGFATRVVPDAALDAEVTRLARELAELDASTLALIKQLFYRLDGLTLTEGVDIGARASALVGQLPSAPAASDRIPRR